MRVQVHDPSVRATAWPEVVERVQAGERLGYQDGLTLYRHHDVAEVGALANLICERKNGDRAFFVRNQHLNPTNICEVDCLFCGFKRDRLDQAGAYRFSLDQIDSMVAKMDPLLTEIHIVSGLDPDLPYEYYLELLRRIKAARPRVHIKAFTAVEIVYYAHKFGKELAEVLCDFQAAGLDALPGGGAEVFADRVRRKLCPDKASASEWLECHRQAHLLGIPTNATILYGHIETDGERVDHFLRLRELEDQCPGFLTFIPLAFQHGNNPLGRLRAAPADADLRNLAAARLLLDNFPHIKAYWVTIGLEAAGQALRFGADEIEGTVVNERIMNMAGSSSGSAVTLEQLLQLIRGAGRRPVERDGLYHIVREADWQKRGQVI